MIKRLLVCFWLSISCVLAQTEAPSTTATAPAQQFPQFKGGNEALMAFIVKHYQYPNAGETSVRFRVTARGTVNSVRVLKTQGAGADKELIRVIKLTSGKWIPGRSNGVAVDMDYIQPLILTPISQPVKRPTVKSR